MSDAQSNAAVQTAQILDPYRRSPNDTGSPEVQIALLTHRIRTLTEHFKTHKKDKHSRFGLLKMVAKRKKFLQYLANIDGARLQAVKQSLGLR